jgi:hypothetical protein
MVVDLAQAGMSYACIATEVYGTMANGQPSESSVKRVGYILAWEQVRVTDYRNARNPMGKSMVAAIRRGAKVIEHIRVASAKAAAATRIRKSA